MTSTARLQRVFTDILGVPEVSEDDDFFALGGHSLLAVQLVSQIQREFGVKLPLRAIYQHLTPAAIAAVLTPSQAPSREGQGL